MSVDDEIKAGIRRLIQEEGAKVEYHERWDGKPKVSEYGWTDYHAQDHVIRECEWIVPEGVTVEEEDFPEFYGTFASPARGYQVGLNAPGCRCKCGKYQDVTLRVETSLGAAIRSLLGYDSTKRMEL